MMEYGNIRREGMIEWGHVKDFSPDEFSEDPDIFASTGLIYALQSARDMLSMPIYPSPVSGALARTGRESMKSQHYADPTKGILSRAVDFFVEGNPVRAFFMLYGSGCFTRIGVYFNKVFDGGQWVMFHGDRKVDFRVEESIWYQLERGQYRFPYRIGFGEFLDHLNVFRGVEYRKKRKRNTA